LRAEKRCRLLAADWLAVTISRRSTTNLASSPFLLSSKLQWLMPRKGWKACVKTYSQSANRRRINNKPPSPTKAPRVMLIMLLLLLLLFSNCTYLWVWILVSHRVRA
jgi:hypothetical protein